MADVHAGAISSTAGVGAESLQGRKGGVVVDVGPLVLMLRGGEVVIADVVECRVRVAWGRRRLAATAGAEEKGLSKRSSTTEGWGKRGSLLEIPRRVAGRTSVRPLSKMVRQTPGSKASRRGFAG